MDIKVSPVKKHCTKLLQKGVRQRRYLLKKKYFDNNPSSVPKESPVLAMNNVEWNALVEHWKDPKMKVSTFLKSRLLPCKWLCIQLLILPFLQKICAANKENRSMVKYQQKTGSRSYAVHLQNLVSQEQPVVEQNTRMGVASLVATWVVFCSMHVLDILI